MLNSSLLGLAQLGVSSSVLNVIGVGNNLGLPLPASTILSSFKLGYDQVGPVYMGPGSTKTSEAFTLTTLDVEQRGAVDRAKKFAMEQSIKAALEKQNLLPQAHSIASKKAQTLNLLSRIYVGSISYDLKEEALRKVFVPFGPIRSVNISWDPDGLKHKGFAFIEFEYPEAAYLSVQQMNNTSLAGRQLKVGRPSNLPNVEPLIEECALEYKLDNRIYVSGVHSDLCEEDLSLVFEAFGKITFCKLIPDPTKAKNHRGFGYINYESPQSAADAMSSMNMFDLGGQFLRVTKAIAPLDESLSLKMSSISASISSKFGFNEIGNVGKITSVDSTAITSRIGSSWDVIESEEDMKNDGTRIEEDEDTVPLERQENVFIRGHDARNLIMQKLSRPTHGVMILRNMVGPEDCDDDLENEIREECSNYGTVEKVLIYQELDENGELIIKIFVVFSDIESTTGAIAALSGRYFAGREVIAEIYDSEKFVTNDLTG